MAALVVLMAMAPVGVGATAPAVTHTAPYKGGVLPSSTLTTYSCNAKAVQVTPWHFHLRTGIGGGADAVSTKACSQIPYRLGSQSQATASGSMEVSIQAGFPSGVRNFSANVTLAYTGVIKETNGSSNGACPSTPFNSISASYYNGTSWSYWPTISHPVQFTNNTYFYYYRNDGASGSCGSYSTLNAGIVGVIIASNGLAGYGLNGVTPSSPSSFSVGGTVATYNSTYWSCYNYTLWSYGSWSNSSGSCSNSNQTAHTQSSTYSTLSTYTTGTNSSMTFTGLLKFTFWYLADFHSISRTWDLFLIPSGSVNCYTYGFPHGTAMGALNMATGGNGVTLSSFTIT